MSACGKTEQCLQGLTQGQEYLCHACSCMQVVYIDGSHDASDVLTDAVMAWKLLAQGGIMILDGVV